MRSAWTAVLAILALGHSFVASHAAEAGHALSSSSTDATRSDTLLQNWVSPELPQHSLVGRIWSAHDGQWSSRTDLAGALSGAAVVLLGEIHDNRDHHRVQAELVRMFAQSRRSKPALVLEMLHGGQGDALATFEASDACCDAGSADAFFDAVGWDKSGWPKRDVYRPLISAAYELGLRPRPGNAPRAEVRAIGRGGLDSLSVAERARLGLQAPLAPPLRAALDDQLFAGHCEMVPRASLAPMAAAQQFRDGTMAAALLHEAPRIGQEDKAGGGAILIAGNGHVREDRGVAWALRQLLPDWAPSISHEPSAGNTTDPLMSVAIVEVAAGQLAPATYVPRTPDGSAAVDFVIFTPRAQRQNMCDVMRERMKAMRAAREDQETEANAEAAE